MRPLNVLIGANGAGKSNFISIFRFLAAQTGDNFPVDVQNWSGPDALLHYGRKVTDAVEFEVYFSPEDNVANDYKVTLAPTGVERSWDQCTAELISIRQRADTPEHINDQPDTKPAAHLERLLRSPRFSKVDHGPIAAFRIGLARIEQECLHFAAWLQKLRELAS